MRRLLAICIFAVLASTVVMAGGASEGTKSKVFSVAMVPPALVSPYFIECGNAAKEAAGKYPNMQFTLLAPSDETKVDQQISIIETLIQKKVDVILISSGNWDAVAPTLKKAIDSGIKVAIFNQLSDVPTLQNIGLVSAVGVNEVDGGKVAGKWIADVLKGKGKIALLEGVAGDYWTLRTGKGIDSVLANYPDIQIVARQPANWERAKGETVAEDILQANPTLDLIAGFNDNMALGAAQAVASSGRRGSIKISGYNGNKEALEAIQSGKMDATVDKQPASVGKTLIDGVAAKIMQGKTSEIPAIIGITPVIITSETVGSYLK
jgi:ribose transport system substrate-binding protein